MGVEPSRETLESVRVHAGWNVAGWHYHETVRCQDTEEGLLGYRLFCIRAESVQSARTDDWIFAVALDARGAREIHGPISVAVYRASRRRALEDSSAPAS